MTALYRKKDSSVCAVKLFDAKLINSESSCTICLKFSGLEHLGMMNIHAHFVAKHQSHGYLNVGTHMSVH